MWPLGMDLFHHPAALMPEFAAAFVVGFASGMPSVRGFLPVEDGGRGEATEPWARHVLAQERCPTCDVEKQCNNPGLCYWLVCWRLLASWHLPQLKSPLTHRSAA